MFLQKIMIEKSKQFDNLMKYSLTEDEKYLKKMEEFYQMINEVDIGFKYGLFDNLLEEFTSCISKGKENTVSNILNLYARTYSKIENLNKMILDKNYKKQEDQEVNNSNKHEAKDILIIDDDVLLLKLIENSMEEEGYNAIVCSNPLQAI